MKEYATDKIRNVCLAGQRGSGKTSLADNVAYVTGVNNRVGSVDGGSSLLDHTESEIARKTSISSKLLACPWKDCKLNLFDAPGHSDFIGDMLSAAKVCDSVGFLIDATSGVEVGTQIQWKYLTDFDVSKFFFVNKMEIENANWKSSLDAIKNAFGKQAVAVQIPLGQASAFKGIVDLLHMKAYEYSGDGKRTETDLPADLKETAEAQHEQLVEVAAEADDTLLEKYFEDGTLSDDDIRKGLKLGINRGKLFPVLFGSAGNGAGVQVLLDFIVEYLPSPDQMPPLKAQKQDSDEIVEVPCDPSGTPLAYVFKIASEGHLGEMAYFRTYSGTVTSGTDFKNIQNNTTERATQIYTFQGKNREDMTSAPAGDIGVLVKLKNTHTGDTLVAGNQNLVVPLVKYPNPVMDVAITSKSKGDEDKVGTGLQKISQEDPTFRLVHDPALKQLVLYGQGSTQIEIISEKLKKRFGVEVEHKKPKIAYRETIKSTVEQQYRHKKQSGGRGQFGEVFIRLSPNERGAGFEFVDEIKGGVIPSKFIPAVEKGIVESMQHGGLAGSQIVDVKVALYYGSYHEVDSSDMAFKIAGSMAFREGFMKAKPVLLEPIYNVEVYVPDDFTGDVMGDLSSRRGKIAGMDPDGTSQRIRATIPQAELYQYSVDLRSMTQGQGMYGIEFSHYEEVPHEIAQKVIEEAKSQQEEDN